MGARREQNERRAWRQQHNGAPQSPAGQSYQPGASQGSLPAGGSEDQVLAKDSGNDFDYSWQDDAGGGDTVYADNVVSLPPSGAYEYITNIYWDPVGLDFVIVHDSAPPTGRLISDPPSGYQIIDNLYWDDTAGEMVKVLGAIIP